MVTIQSDTCCDWWGTGTGRVWTWVCWEKIVREGFPEKVTSKLRSEGKLPQPKKMRWTRAQRREKHLDIWEHNWHTGCRAEEEVLGGMGDIYDKCQCEQRSSGHVQKLWVYPENHEETLKDFSRKQQNQIWFIENPCRLDCRDTRCAWKQGEHGSNLNHKRQCPEQCSGSWDLVTERSV